MRNRERKTDFGPVCGLQMAAAAPVPFGGFVATRAFNRLCAERAMVTIVTAPPGYGKTSLLRALSDSATRNGDLVSWRALDGISGGHLIDPADVIVIDDAHDADPRKFARLIRTITSSDATQNFVIATRTLPDMDWMSLEATGRVEILRVEDLLLDEEETGALLAFYAGQSPSLAEVGHIFQWIEGWPIAAQWYGMLARRRGGWSGVHVGASHPQDNLRQYLNESIYVELDDAMRDFLFDLADLGRFSSAMLCELIGASADLQLQRARLENVMIVPASADGEWLRLHGIFQQFIDLKKRQAGLSRNISLLRAASLWCEGRGAYCDAIEYALDADDLDRAHDLLVMHAAHLVQGLGELPRMLTWTERLERSGRAISTPLRLWRIWALVLSLQLGPAQEELDRLLAQMPADPPRAWLAHSQKLRISIAARGDDMAQVIALADEWMRLWEGQDSFHTAAICVLRALAHFQLGDRHAARRDLMIARQRAGDGGGLYGQLWVAKADAWLELQSGRALRAREIILSALNRARASDEIAVSTVATLHLLAARILVETGEVEIARTHLAAGHLHSGDNGLIETHVAALDAATLLAEDADGADAALCETQYRLVPGLRYSVRADLLAIGIELRHGRVEEAGEEFRAAFARKSDEWTHAGTGRRIPDCMVPQVEQAAAWLGLASGQPQVASEVVARLLPMAEATGRTRDHVILLMLSASCCLAMNRLAEARRNLERALRIAADRGFHRTIVDHGWALTPLLADPEFLSAVMGDEAARLAEALRRRYGIQTDIDREEPPMERLTAREQEVLAMLDTGLTSQAIANHMDLGLSTTKWHIQNIYNKLGVRNRTGALARARRLAII